jgi:predicted ATP-dependent serine protease
VLVTLEGTRPLLVEVQALVDSGGPEPAPALGRASTATGWR